MTKIDRRIIIKWNDSEFAWVIRGLKPDGSFYGTYRKKSDTSYTQRNFDGMLSQSVYAQIVISCESIKSHLSAFREVDDFCDGLLAEGYLHNPCILFEYRKSVASNLDSEFLMIIQNMRDYINK